MMRMRTAAGMIGLAFACQSMVTAAVAAGQERAVQPTTTAASRLECPSSSVSIKDRLHTPEATQSSDKAAFAYLLEVVRGNLGKPITDKLWEVDTHSLIYIDIFKNATSSKKPTPKQIPVTITLIKGDATTPYQLADWNWMECGTLLLGPRLDMNDSKLQDKDAVSIAITNTLAADSPVYTFNLTRKDLGWHRSISDTVAFIQRLGVSKADVANGIAKVNFAPAPGVTLATSYAPRREESLGLFRFLSPGIGITASFFDWKDQSVTLDTSNPNMPTFSSGAKSSDISLGLGAQLSLMDGSISVLYGWNLQGTGPRRYWGIGISFVNVYQKIQSYTSASTASAAATAATAAKSRTSQ